MAPESPLCSGLSASQATSGEPRCQPVPAKPLPTSRTGASLRPFVKMPNPAKGAWGLDWKRDHGGHRAHGWQLPHSESPGQPVSVPASVHLPCFCMKLNRELFPLFPKLYWVLPPLVPSTALGETGLRFSVGKASQARVSCGEVGPHAPLQPLQTLRPGSEPAGGPHRSAQDTACSR